MRTSFTLTQSRKAAPLLTGHGGTTSGRVGTLPLLMGVVLLNLLAQAVPAAAQDATLVREGQITTTLLVTEELAAQTEGQYAEGGDGTYIELAVAELRAHLALVGEGELEVQHLPAGETSQAAARLAGDRAVLVLGGPELDGQLAEAIREQSESDAPDPEAFALTVADGVVKVVGLSPKGALNGAYEVLEQIGFRWYMPGEIGRVVPEGEPLALAAQRSIEVPSFRGRQTPGSSMRRFGAWQRRMRQSAWGGAAAGHGIAPLKTSGQRRAWFEQDEAHHEHFRLIDGERAPGQLCISNPEVLEMATEAARQFFRENPDRQSFGMGPNDGSGFCECEDCRALDSGSINPFTNRRSVTDRYIWFYNQVLEAIEDEFPDAQIGTLIYSDTMMPPEKVEPHPNIVGKTAFIHLCRIHGPTNPVCPERHIYRNLTERWHEAGVRVYNSGYWFNLADPGLPFIMVHRIREAIPLSHRLDHLGFSRMPAAQWANETPSLYLVHKLMWDHEADVDALLDDFFNKFYGPAAEPMRRYIMTLDAALRDADHHTGRSWDLLHIYDEQVRSTAREALAEARQRATEGEDMHGTRVEIAAKGWAYFEAFAEMVESRRAHEYVTSMRALERARELIKELTEGYETPMLRVTPSSVNAERFLNALYANVTESAHARVTDGNELLVGLDEVWQFMQDPQVLGETMELYRPKVTGGNWRPMNTSSSWSNQGLRYYFGQAWYRQRVDVPDVPAARAVRIWFASVDHGAQVWVNGEFLGTSPGAEFDIDAHGGTTAPFEFDATEAVRPGKPNTVVVRVNRSRMNELGTGGLMGPVMFYIAAD